MDKVSLSNILAELRELRIEVDRLHARWDASESEPEGSREDGFEAEVEYSVRLQREVWRRLGLEMHRDMVSMAKADRQIQSRGAIQS